jgi:two-component system NtrC family response regulator
MKKILFVDDNQILCRLSCDILRREGYDAVPAYDGIEALQRFTGDDDFDIVVTDMRMGGMDGLALARAIHDRRPDVPVIMVTAYGPVQAGEIKTCLAKDGMFPTLLEKIQMCLSEREAKEVPTR